MKHFNRGFVLGGVMSLKKEIPENSGTPYVVVKLAANEFEGRRVVVYGRLWGEKKIAALETLHTENPQRLVKCEGAFGQYVSSGRRYNQYNFYKIELAAGEQRRAAFILVGVVKKVTIDTAEDPFGRGIIEIEITLEDKKPQLLVIQTDAEKVTDLKPDMTIEAKGYMRAYSDDGDYGEKIFKGVPYADHVKIKGTI